MHSNGYVIGLAVHIELFVCTKNLCSCASEVSPTLTSTIEIEIPTCADIYVTVLDKRDHFRYKNDFSVQAFLVYVT